MARAAAVSALKRRKPPSKSRRDQLLDEAARQLNARGVSQASLADVADQLGFTRNALYYYVDDREDLVFQVYRRSCEILARHLGESARSGRKALDVVRGFVASTLDPDEAEIAALSELGLLRPAERETVVALYEGVVARLASVLEAGAQAGEIRHCDYTVAARCIISMIYWAPLAPRWTMAAATVDREQLIELINDLLAYGIAVDRTKTVDPPWIDLSPLVAPKVAAFDRDALGKAKREAILVTASRLFNTKGVDATSLEEIAAALGATKRTLYHYVGDKGALLSACYERAYRIYFFIADSVTALGLAPEEERVAWTRAGAVAQLSKDLSPLRPLVGFDALNEEQRGKMEALSRELSEHAIRRMTRAQKEGAMRPFDVSEMLLVTPGMSIWLAKDLVEINESQQNRISDQVAQMVLLGLAAV